MDRAELIAFEREVAERFDAGEITGPVHLNSDTQADPLIEIFKGIKRTDCGCSNAALCTCGPGD